MNKKDQKKWTLLLNPHAGGGKGKRDFHRILELLQRYEIVPDVFVSEYPKHAIKLVKEAIENGSRKIIVAGGDGTLNEVVNGIFMQNACLSQEIVLGMIPVGTGNDWIKTFGIANDYEEAIKFLSLQKVFFQDIGKLSFTSNEQTEYRYFSNMAGFGFDALVAKQANCLKAKGRSGLLVYLQSLAWAFINYKTRKVKILMDGDEQEDLIFSVSVGIGKFNGGGMMQAPDAVPDNGMFELTLIKKIGLWGILTNLVGLYNGSYVKDKRVVCYKAKNVAISSAKSIQGEVDGESLGESRFEIEILPRKLQVVVGDMILSSI